MTFDIHVIVNTITLGLITTMFGLKEDQKWRIMLGSAITSVGIILNLITVLNGG